MGKFIFYYTFLFAFCFGVLNHSAQAQEGKPEDLGVADVDTFVTRSFTMKAEHKTFSDEFAAISSVVAQAKETGMNKDDFEAMSKKVEALQKKIDKIQGDANGLNSSAQEMVKSYGPDKMKELEGQLASTPKTNLAALKELKNQITSVKKAISNVSAGAGAVSAVVAVVPNDVAKMGQLVADIQSVEQK